MSDNGDGNVLELSSGELEGDSSASVKFKCNLSSDNIPLSMGLNTEYCNNGGTNVGNLGLSLLQNFDENNLFQCDISGVFEWIRQRTDSVSSADLECMRIDCNEATVTTSELTSSSEDPVCVSSDLDVSSQIDPTFSTTVSSGLSNQSQNDHLNSSLLDELTCLQADDQLIKTVPESVFQYSLPLKEITKFGSLSCQPKTPVKNTVDSLSKDTVGTESLSTKSINDNINSKLRILKNTNSLPFVKVPKKCILSGKILKKDAYSFLGKNALSTLSQQSNFQMIPAEVQTSINHEGSGSVPQTDFTSEPLCVNEFENAEEMQLMLTEDRLKSPFSDENLQTNENNALLQTCISDNQEKSGSKTVVAISTNKLEDTTEVFIKTENGEELYKGKASELLKATNSSPNLLLRFDPATKDKQKLLLQKSGSLKLESDLDEATDAVADNEKVDDGGVNEDEPITEALKALGITNDQLENLEVIKGQQGQRSWFCPIDVNCDNVFNKLSSLKIHILTHFKLRPFKCNYSGCEWSFYTNFRLKRHKETHLRKKEFKCTLEGCNRSFTTVYNLHTHLKLHERPADLLCPVPNCGQAFQTRRNMESHLKEHGTEHAPYACYYEGCQKRYYSPSALHSHSRTHLHSIDDLKCQYCLKVFDKPCRLKAHLRSHTGVKPYKCNYEGCDWAFTTSSKLNRHQAKHTQERRFVCNLCAKAFLRSEHLKDHTIKHFLTKAFVCPYEGCGQQFTAKSSLYVHLKKHRKKDDCSAESSLPNQTKLSCPVDDCRHVFSSKDEIPIHILNFHKNINIEVKDLKTINSIELMNDDDRDDNLISLEGLHFKNDSSVSALNLRSISPEGVVISLPEYINNTDISGLSILSTPPTACQVELTGNIQNSSQDVSYTDASVNSICAVTTNLDIGSARTGLTYQDAVAERELRKNLNKKPPIICRKRGLTQSVDCSLKDSNAMQVTSDIVLTAGLLGGSQENLSRSLMFQDDLPSGSDLYGSITDESSFLENNGCGEFLQVFIVDSSGIRNSDFEQSTINLRDLE